MVQFFLSFCLFSFCKLNLKLNRKQRVCGRVNSTKRTEELFISRVVDAEIEGRILWINRGRQTAILDKNKAANCGLRLLSSGVFVCHSTTRPAIIIKDVCWMCVIAGTALCKQCQWVMLDRSIDLFDQYEHISFRPRSILETRRRVATARSLHPAIYFNLRYTRSSSML